MLDCSKDALEYEFGYEESYGCLVGTHARDKDAVVAVMALCEAAAFYKSKGLTLCDQMQNIYKKYGYYLEDLESITLKGADGSLLPVSNVLYFELENNGWCCARHSGTEPKIKFYFGVKGKNLSEAQELLAAVKRGLMKIAT